MWSAFLFSVFFIIFFFKVCNLITIPFHISSFFIIIIINQLQIENRALRLRENSSPFMNYVDETSPSIQPTHQQSTRHNNKSDRPSWDYFDEQNYIHKGSLRTGEDPYIRNRFNQQASDRLASNRAIPDTRNQM